MTKRKKSDDYKAVHPSHGFIRSLNTGPKRGRGDNVPLTGDTPLDIGQLFIRHRRDHSVSMSRSGHIFTDNGELLF